MPPRRTTTYRTKANPVASFSLLLTVAVPIVALISSLSILIYKVSLIQDTTSKTNVSVLDNGNRLIVLETLQNMTEPTKRQGASNGYNR